MLDWYITPSGYISNSLLCLQIFLVIRSDGNYHVLFGFRTKFIRSIITEKPDVIWFEGNN
jgi:hypothetical protein